MPSGGQLFVDQTFADDTGHGRCEPPAVGVGALVEPENLLVNVAAKVGRINGNVSPLDGPLEQRPEILKGVGMAQACDVLAGMANCS